MQQNIRIFTPPETLELLFNFQIIFKDFPNIADFTGLMTKEGALLQYQAQCIQCVEVILTNNGKETISKNGAIS